MTIRGAANLSPVLWVGRRTEIIVAMHLVYGLSLGHVAVQTVRNRLVKEIGCFAMKGLSIGSPGHGREIMPFHQFRVIVASATGLGDIERASALVQPGCDVIVKAVDKFFFLVTNATAAKGILGNTGSNFFDKCQGSEHGIIMTILTGWHIFGKWFFDTILVFCTVNTVG